MIDLALISVTIIVAVLRFIITPRLNLPTAEGSYEAFAHLFVGGLFGAWIVTTDWKRYRYPWCSSLFCTDGIIPCWNCMPKELWRVCRNLYFLLAIGVSLLELAMFVIQKSAADG